MEQTKMKIRELIEHIRNKDGSLVGSKTRIQVSNDGKNFEDIETVEVDIFYSDYIAREDIPQLGKSKK